MTKTGRKRGSEPHGRGRRTFQKEGTVSANALRFRITKGICGGSSGRVLRAGAEKSIKNWGVETTQQGASAATVKVLLFSKGKGTS